MCPEMNGLFVVAFVLLDMPQSGNEEESLYFFIEEIMRKFLLDLFLIIELLLDTP